MTTLARVQALVGEQLGVEEPGPNALLAGDLGADSLDLIALEQELQATFGLAPALFDLRDATVQEVADFVDQARR